MEYKRLIEEELCNGINDNLEEQEASIIKCIGMIMDDESTNQSEFTIYLRDFLLDYIK